MKIPAPLQPLIEEGLIDDVISRLMSGKEADVFVVRRNDEILCAKVYKAAEKRSFKQAVLYREGRKTRNSRRARAMDKGSKYGRDQQEQVWHTAELDALTRLADAGVRVPRPFACIDGVLLMELVTDSEGDVAPRLSEVFMSAEEALAGHAEVIRYVVRMLCAGPEKPQPPLTRATRCHCNASKNTSQATQAQVKSPPSSKAWGA